MRDRLGREIDYLRVSVTDRCNLRCRYCMPSGVPSVEHTEVLRYEELLRLCSLAVGLGIHAFKVTGGEPLVRRVRHPAPPPWYGARRRPPPR